MGEMAAGEEALAEVAADDLLGLADRGKVGAGVPAQQQIQVQRELRQQVRGRGGVAEIGNEQVGDAGFGERWHKGTRKGKRGGRGGRKGARRVPR
jgi:hypothetical protein